MKKLTNGIYTLTLGEAEELTPFRVLKPQSRLEQLNDLPDHQPPFDENEIRVSYRSGSLLLELPLKQDEEIYGLGLTLKSFRQTGLKKTLRANSDPTADNGDSHAPVPFYVSSKGYGVYVDTCRHIAFHCGNVKVLDSVQDREGYPSAGTDRGRWWIRQGSGNMFIDIHAAQGVTLYFFCGRSMLDAVARYNLFSGGGALIPRWGLGVMYRGYMHGDARHMLRLAHMLREQEIPCDIFGLEPGWQTHAYSCTYKWDPERYPDPEGFLDEMRLMGYHVNLWEHAYVHPDSPVFSAMRPHAGNCYVWDGLVPDFTDDQARHVFQDLHAGLAEQGVDGFKLDECDSSDFTANWGFPDFAAFPGGMDGEQMHAVFGSLYQRTIQEVYHKLGRRTYGEVRQAGAFAAPMPYVLYSDLYDHTDFVRGMASAAFSGLLWTPEVRQADSGKELLRRLAAAVVSPQTVINAYMVAMPPWMQYDREKNIAGIVDPEHEELTAACRTLLRMRMALVPHLYTAFMRYYAEGIPPIRPLVMDYQEDRETLDIYDQYMLGEGLMAAPLTADMGDKRRVYLPQGIWYELAAGLRLPGGTWIEAEPALDEIPLYVREGTLLALAEPRQCLDARGDFELDVTAYGSGDCACTLVCDDGEQEDLLPDGIPRVRLCVRDGQLRIEGELDGYHIRSFRRVE